MKNAAITPSLLSVLIAPALAVVTFPITRREDFHPDIIHARNLFARTPINEALLNNRTLYQANVTVGTPPQPFSLDIDTGSSDVYILDKNADQCTSASVQDSAGGGCYGGTCKHPKAHSRRARFSNELQLTRRHRALSRLLQREHSKSNMATRLELPAIS
jgi:hypothetical protein